MSTETTTTNTELKITAGTIARTIILVIALINQVLTLTGHSIIPIADETVNEIVSVLFTVITALISWWKNNSYSNAALKADELMKALKLGISEETAESTEETAK